MCGICGKLFFDKGQRIDEQSLKVMTRSMYHRGPDDEGYYISGQIGLGHRRLSIIDLQSGKQPISNEDNSVWIVFNGEIYNYLELRIILLARNHKFKTESDTEVIIHGYEEYGADIVNHLRGMFAFAIWNERDKTLFIARDRVGIKPLYYYLNSKYLIFASEIKSILSDPSVNVEMNYPAIGRFLTYKYLPGNETLIKDILKLSPGHYLIGKNREIKITQYWDLHFPDTLNGNGIERKKQELLELLKETLSLHMISDVPVGFLLSGGVDSTALLSLSLECENRDLSTFTIGFEGQQFEDERKYGRLAAQIYGTRHYEMTIDASKFYEFLPKYIWHMEEPVCEPPAIALYYISKLASEHVKVLISGEGGDEAFAGYQTYRNFIWLERLKSILKPFKSGIYTLIDNLPNVDVFRKFKKYNQFIPVSIEDYYYSRSASPFSYFNSDFKISFSESLRREIDDKYSIKPTSDLFRKFKSKDKLTQMLYVDTKTWLPDDLLIKADKITMANSVELRVPLLDHKVLEFAAALPSNMKVKGFTTKYLLKQTFEDRIPLEIINRKKTGFPVPVNSWIKNELHDFICETLLDKRTLERDYFNADTLKNILQKNRDDSSYASEIFSLLILELWHRNFIENKGWKLQ